MYDSDELSEKPVLECLQCRRRYSEADVAAGLYWPQTFVCSHCYAQLQAAPFSVSCFGKLTELVVHTGVRLYGYDSRATECVQMCPDRDVCKLVCNRKEN